jgi:SAM-dependent methyltransferase
MNRPEDWDVIWRWQWFRRPLWQPYFRDPGHPEGRAAKTAPIWQWLLQQNGAHRVLDCNCGLGQRTMILKDLGFDMVGADGSTEAIQHATELAEIRNVDLPFRQCTLQNLGEVFGAEFDAVLNDQFCNTLSRADLRFSAHNFASVLRPGGIFVFQGADDQSNPADKPRLVEDAWQAAPRFQLRSVYERDGTHVSLVVARDKDPDGVVENYLFTIRDAAGVRLETAAICHSLKWTWDDYQAVFREAGFSCLETVRIPVGRREIPLNVARK